MKKSLIILASLLAMHLHLHAQDIVNVIELSQGPGAYAVSNNITRLWADDNLSTVAFLHPVYPALGTTQLAYDLSINGGETWTLNIPVYDPGQGGLPAHYAQGGIYNPAGNTNPELAYYTWFALSQDGQYLSGIHKLDQSSDPIFNIWDGVACSGPLSFTINPLSGDVFTVAPVVTISGYDDSLAVSRGVFNEATGNYDFSQVLLPLPAQAEGIPMPLDVKISFGPDGLTGYISILFDNLSDPFAAGGGIYPILMKTTDGGLSWGDPMAVILGGPDGLPGIKNYLMDEQWHILWPPPQQMPRDSVVFQTAYEHGLGVDMFGNPHIGVTIGVSGIHFDNPYEVIADYGFGATFHIYSQDQGSSWIARHVTNNKTFRGCNETLCWDNLTQVSMNMGGSVMALSWIDTDFVDVAENTLPDLWCQGFHVQSQNYSEVHNVTFLSDIWLEAFMATASPNLLTGNLKLIVPFATQGISKEGIFYPVTHRYISDYTLDIWVGIQDPSVFSPALSVLQNFPNPVSSVTSITIHTALVSNLSIHVHNLHGQQIKLINLGIKEPGSQIIQLDMSGFAPGFYFYTVKANEQTVTRKMILK
ncbi:MAG: T9SS type A sorting domain-containing protein [Bacteroidales bacterium]|nr:T9SS type A sorting domain-containing protein [Bacteroidales bacterium]